MKLSQSNFLLFFLLCFFIGKGQLFDQQQKLVPSDRASSDQFGWSVDIQSNRAIIGAPTKTDSIGGQLVGYIGAAYIFEKDTNGWHEVVQLKASDFKANTEFGNDVAINGNTAVVCAYKTDIPTSSSADYGAAYVFERDSSGNWNETQKLVASTRTPDAEFGSSIAFDGKNLIIASHQRTLGADPSNPSTNISYAGSALLFQRDSMGLWQEVQEITPDSSYGFQRFAHSMALYDSTLVAGVPTHGAMVNGQMVSNVGLAYVFKMDSSGLFKQTQKLNPGIYNPTNSGSRFGSSLALSQNYLVVGEPGRQNGGAASVFKLDTANNWTFSQQVQQAQSWSAYVGTSVDVFGDNIFIGAPGHYQTSFSKKTGCVYWYSLDSTQNQFTYLQTIYANDKEKDDNFGRALAVGSTGLLIGAYLEEEDTSGSNPLPFAGSAYLFDFNCSIDSIEVIRNDFTFFVDSLIPATYTWVNCDSAYLPVTGGNLYNFTATQNGNYAVIRNWNTCLDTSECFTVNDIRLPSIQDLDIRVYPNPIDNYLKVDFGAYLQDVELRIVSPSAQTLYSCSKKSAKEVRIDWQYGPDGIYFLEIRCGDHFEVIKLIKK